MSVCEKCSKSDVCSFKEECEREERKISNKKVFSIACKHQSEDNRLDMIRSAAEE